MDINKVWKELGHYFENEEHMLNYFQVTLWYLKYCKSETPKKKKWWKKNKR